ncbi:MAG: hypothetical protein E7588_05720 [Ruminococcaceae bacterium]|nr:hypothetical protein [Oscillospiraceae bacterium]
MPIYEKDPVFACACTAYGFKSLFDSIFDPEKYKRVYILKGTCGSGKSALIRKIARECRERSSEYELFSCSFDPDSFDGIIIRSRDTCIVDGTSPHITEPKYPGAVEIVLNTGKADENALKERRNEIIDLCKKSSAAFGKSYSFLRASLELENSYNNIITENFRFDKMFCAIKRFCDRDFVRGTGFIRENRLINVICKDGLHKSGAFLGRASKKCLVLDKPGGAYLAMEEIVSTAARYDQPVTVSVSPLDFEKINGVWLPELDMAFGIENECESRDDWYHVFNMARFTDKVTVSRSKNKLRFLNKCKDKLILRAADSMAEAYFAHMELESIYNANTDYSVNNILYEKLVKEIFG